MSYLDDLMTGAATEAKRDGSPAVEAHHLLLAVAAQRSPAPGLDHAAVRAALDLEFARSLAAAGVHISGVPHASPTDATPGLGASARAALERGLATVRDKRDIRPGHILLGVLLAEVGTVPRALALSGHDRVALLAAVRRELDR